MSRKHRKQAAPALPVNTEAVRLQDQAKIAEARVSLAESKRRMRTLRLTEARERSARNTRNMESWLVNGVQIMNRLDYQPPGYGLDNPLLMGGAQGYWLSTQQSREHGRDWPFIQTDVDIAGARGMARYVTTLNSVGVGVKENLNSYVVRDGFTVSVTAKRNSSLPTGLTSAVMDVLEDFFALNSWKCAKEVEFFWRGRRDGETFATLYPDKEGRTRLRFTEPEQIWTPESQPFTEEELYRQFGLQIPCATNWDFGVHKADHDAECVYGYCAKFTPEDDWTYLPATNVVHWKLNVDSTIARGLSDFVPAWEWLLQQARLLRNTGEGAAQLAAIAYIVQHAMASASEVESMRKNNADTSWTTRTQAGNTKTFYRENVEAGSRMDVPLGQEYLPGPAGHERGIAFLQIVQGILRQAGTRWCMTEGMISGDDSNNNMASMSEAGGRFHTFCVSQQGRLQQQYLDLFWRVVWFAYQAGRFARFHFASGEKTWAEMKRDIIISVDAPDVDPKTRLNRTQQRNVLYQNRVMSRASWQTAEGFDPEEEDGNIANDKLASQPGQGSPGGNPGGGMPGMPGVAGPEGQEELPGGQEELLPEAPVTDGEPRRQGERLAERSAETVRAHRLPAEAPRHRSSDTRIAPPGSEQPPAPSLASSGWRMVRGRPVYAET